MYAKSFLAFDGNGRLTGARTAQTAPYDRYTCHLCGSALRYHPQYDTVTNGAIVIHTQRLKSDPGGNLLS
ncbi:hypothetical protein [Escherichia coli]|uniref:DUF7828 domain-containing protein n=1 Tax=Escherichia coli TaxID=562 RepID=UPI001988ECBA|nr:hypothetical protein [Escherichia coli]MDA5358916.1 hypothetical protein [Escherichia coli]